MDFAQIRGGVIINVIVIDDPTIVELFIVDPFGGPNFDAIVRIDNISPEPQIGWTTSDNVNFTPP